jgi:amidase
MDEDRKTMMDPAFDPAEKGVAALAAALAQGRTSSVRLVDAYLARIAAYDRAGPELHAMICLHPGARDEAVRLDDERARGICRGVLHGLPMVVKDNIDVAGLPTTAGSVLWRDHVAPRDAAVVRALREAGAIVLGKSNMSEFACSNGWYGYSSLGGLTRNPYNPARNAAGSSSGSAAAVAAGFAAYALGTDTFGSIRAPSCVAGLVGLRPTPGLCPNDGIVPLAPAFDVVGPMARSVADAAIVLRAMTGGGVAMSVDGSAGLKPEALRGARLGIALEFPGEGEVAEIFRAACGAMARAGADMIPIRLPDGATSVHADFLGPLADAQWEDALAAYFAGREGDWPRSLAALAGAASAPAAPDRERPINPRTVAFLGHALAQAGAVSPARRAALLGLQSTFRDALCALLRRARLDAIVYPSLSCPASPRFDLPDPAYVCTAGNFYLPLYVASASGMPDVTVPAGMARAGVPVGVSFMGPPWGEAGLLALAHGFEQATHARVPPRLPRP